MKLKDLLKTHDHYHPKNAIKNNFGDGYLLTHNPIYAAIRIRTLEAKFKFTSDRFHDYDVLALTQLPLIFKKKLIPFRDNIRPLREVEEIATQQFLFQELPPLRANHLFHESAHVVAHTLIERRLPKSKFKNRPYQTHLVFHTLLEEAFANACESLANIYSENAVHDEFLFKNSYIMERPSVRLVLRQAVSRFGIESIFALLIFSFLHANFLRLKDPTAFKRVIKIIFKRPPDGLPKLAKIFKTGFELDTDFTHFTNSFCLKLQGVKDPGLILSRLDFLSVFEQDEAYRALLRDLVQSIQA